MQLSEYQKLAQQTAIYPSDDRTRAINYLLVALFGEMGEFANKLKKIARDQNREFYQHDLDMLAMELGDVLWYLSELSRWREFTWEGIDYNPRKTPDPTPAPTSEALYEFIEMHVQMVWTENLREICWRRVDAREDAFDQIMFMMAVQEVLLSIRHICLLMPNGWTIERIANENIKKLEERAKRGTLAGSGDIR